MHQRIALFSDFLFRNSVASTLFKKLEDAWRLKLYFLQNYVRTHSNFTILRRSFVTSGVLSASRSGHGSAIQGMYSQNVHSMRSTLITPLDPKL